jgi:general stress protein YciG
LQHLNKTKEQQERENGNRKEEVSRNRKLYKNIGRKGEKKE